MLKLEHVFAGYKEKNVLTDLSLHVPKGQMTVIIGPNGCGKTTMLKTMLGLLQPRSGTVLLQGDSLCNMKRSEIAKRLAYLSQGKATPDMTVEQLVLHGRFAHLSYPRRYSKNDRAIARAAMERMGIKSLADHPLASLSGGMRQTVYLAMALAQEADGILLDEPTTYLDASHALQFMELLKTLTLQGKTVVAVMHDLPLSLSFADRVVLLNHGALAFCGAPDDLYRSKTIESLLGIRIGRDEASGDYFYIYQPTATIQKSYESNGGIPT